MPLSAIAVNKAKPRPKAYKLADERGLYLLVSPTGGRYWRMNFRFADKSRTIAFGVFPDVSLADARARRDNARKLLANGIDPTEERKEEEARIEFQARSSFRAVAEEWLTKREREGLGEVTVAKARWLLNFAYPFLGGTQGQRDHNSRTARRSAEGRGSRPVRECAATAQRLWPRLSLRDCHWARRA